MRDGSSPHRSDVADAYLTSLMQRTVWEEKERALRRTIDQLSADVAHWKALATVVPQPSPKVVDESTPKQFKQSPWATEAPRPSPPPPPPPAPLVFSVGTMTRDLPPPPEVRRAADELIARQAAQITDLENEVRRLTIALKGARSDQASAVTSARAAFAQSAYARHDTFLDGPRSYPQGRPEVSTSALERVAEGYTPTTAVVSALRRAYSGLRAQVRSTPLRSTTGDGSATDIVWPTPSPIFRSERR
jgi:hypothetical protein